MFSKTDKNAKKPQPVHTNAPSIISAGLTIVGNLRCDGELQIDGAVDGDIISNNLVIGKNAVVTGHIEANNILIKGRVNGLIRARIVELAPDAEVVGDIVHEELSIQNGASLEGHCRRETIGDVTTALKEEPALSLASESNATPGMAVAGE